MTKINPDGNINPQDNNRKKVSEEVMKTNFFNSLFSEYEKKELDKNKNKNIEISEVHKALYNHIKGNITLSDSILKKFEKIFGDAISKNKFLGTALYEINDIYERNFKSANARKDDIFTIEEARKAYYFGKDFYDRSGADVSGFLDGKIDNKQGKIGDCWLLSVAKSLASDGRLGLYLKQNPKTGEVTVTFEGVKDKDGKPWTTKISLYDLNHPDLSRIQSNDPDAKALEIAMERWMQSRNQLIIDAKNKFNEFFEKNQMIPTQESLMKVLDKDRQLLAKYAKESPDKAGNLGISPKGRELVAYMMKYSEPTSDEAKAIKEEFSKYGEKDIMKMSEYIEKMEIYINNSKYNNKKPGKLKTSMYENEKTLEKNWIDFYDFFELTGFNAEDSGFTSKDYYFARKSEYPYPHGINNGQTPDFAIRIITGEEVKREVFAVNKDELKNKTPENFKKYTKEKKKEINNILDSIKNGKYNKTIIVSFEGEGIQNNHGYSVLGVKGNKIKLSNPHESNKIIEMKKSDFIKKLRQYAIEE